MTDGLCPFFMHMSLKVAYVDIRRTAVLWIKLRNRRKVNSLPVFLLCGNMDIRRKTQ